MPDSFATSADGLLLVANGIDPVLRWDGLTDEAQEAGLRRPTVAPAIAASGVGSITGTYTAYLRYIDDRGNPSNLSPISNTLVAASNGTITYTGVQIPTLQSKVRRRQLLRNTDGQARVYYVDVDTADLTSDSFDSTLTDSLLQVQEAVALFDVENNNLSEIHGVPPDTKAFIAAHNELMFLAGEEQYSVGSVAVQFGNFTVVGHGTEWPANFVGRFLWLPYAEEYYEILSVDPVAQQLGLARAYEGPTDPYTRYAIRPEIASRRFIHYSETGEPESWAATSAVQPQETGDEITGLMPFGSFLMVLERRHIHRMSFQESPLADGAIYLGPGRGVVNNRCWAVVDGRAYCLDESGIYAFLGGKEVEELSAPIQDIFEPSRGGREPRYRVRWEASRWFHACYDPAQRVVRWFVTLEGTGIPRHAICLDLSRMAWWAEEFPFPVGASVVGPLRGSRRVFLGGPGGRVYTVGEGTLDLVDGGVQKVRGSVTIAGRRSLTDSQANFTDGCVNAPVRITDGRGKGQVRVITSVTSTRLSLDRCWGVKPDTTSVYQIGGVRYRYRTGWFRYVPMDRENVRRLEVVFEPTDSDSTLDARLYQDRSRAPVTWDYTQTNAQADGFSVTKGLTDWVADLTKTIGLVQRQIDSQKDLRMDGPRFISWELAGVTNKDAVTVYEITIDGVRGRD
jgi:hypothetical protein